MDTTYFEEYQKQFMEWQKKFFDNWLENVSTGKNAFKLPENMDKGLEVQEELVGNYLAAQETAVKLALETQKKFWDSYFELMKKAANTKIEVGV